MKTILITGASSGFGRLTALKFHQQGWNVVASMRSPEKEQELNKLDKILIVKLDVTDKCSVQTAISQSIEKFGRIDALINNAGYGGYGLIEQFDDDTIRNMFETNVFGIINTIQEVLPFMRKQGSGSIINITSIAGFVASPMVSVYSATKYAVQGLTQSLAMDYKSLGIEVKSVAPGSFETGFISSAVKAFNSDDDQVIQLSQKLSNHINEVREQFRNMGRKTPDPQEVAEKIFECVTATTPIHNYAGADSIMTAKMKNDLSEHEFQLRMIETLLPNN